MLSGCYKDEKLMGWRRDLISISKLDDAYKKMDGFGRL
jgi:hypothetical protein